MDRRWYKVWPLWVPKSFDVEKPTSEYIREWAEMRPQGVAISFYGRDITYRELNTMIDKAAWALVNTGVKKGDRVAILMDNCPQFIVAYFGIQRAGGVVVPVNPMFKQMELEHEFNDAGVETLISLDSLYEEVEKIRAKTPLKRVILTSLKEHLPTEPVLPVLSEMQAPPRIFAETFLFEDLLAKADNKPICNVDDIKEDLALLQYTGGTTGIPKGAMITHHTLSYVNIGTMYWYHHREEDVHLTVTPLFHVMGQQESMCTPLVSGGRVVLLARFIPDTVAQAVAHYRCNVWIAATTMIIALLSIPKLRNYDLSSLRCLNTGGGPVSLELQRQMKELLPTALVGEGFGMSETLPQGGATTPFYRYKPGFVGIPQLNDVRIVDLETGTVDMPANEQGEMIMKGPAVMKGYWNKPEETKEALRDGWLHTGDIALMDEDGYIQILGRKRELIKCSGFSVFPAEVEDLLYRHPAVKETAVIGVQDSYRGETPKAFIILKPEYEGKITEQTILDWCKANMATYKRPRIVEFRKELPKSGAGKILKRLLE